MNPSDDLIFQEIWYNEKTLVIFTKEKDYWHYVAINRKTGKIDSGDKVDSAKDEIVKIQEMKQMDLSISKHFHVGDSIQFIAKTEEEWYEVESLSTFGWEVGWHGKKWKTHEKCLTDILSASCGKIPNRLRIVKKTLTTEVVQ